jgi:hypothetical protein
VSVWMDRVVKARIRTLSEGDMESIKAAFVLISMAFFGVRPRRGDCDGNYRSPNMKTPPTLINHLSTTKGAILRLPRPPCEQAGVFTISSTTRLSYVLLAALVSLLGNYAFYCHLGVMLIRGLRKMHDRETSALVRHKAVSSGGGMGRGGESWAGGFMDGGRTRP